jgi:hypothetical protein
MRSKSRSKRSRSREGKSEATGGVMTAKGGVGSRHDDNKEGPKKDGSIESPGKDKPADARQLRQQKLQQQGQQ